MAWSDLQDAMHQTRARQGLSRVEVAARAQRIESCPEGASDERLRHLEDNRRFPPADPAEVLIYCSAMGMSTVAATWHAGWLPGVLSPYSQATAEHAVKQLAEAMGLEVVKTSNGLLVRLSRSA